GCLRRGDPRTPRPRRVGAVMGAAVPDPTLCLAHARPRLGTGGPGPDERARLGADCRHRGRTADLAPPPCSVDVTSRGVNPAAEPAGERSSARLTVWADQAQAYQHVPVRAEPAPGETTVAGEAHKRDVTL